MMVLRPTSSSFMRPAVVVTEDTKLHHSTFFDFSSGSAVMNLQEAAVLFVDLDYHIAALDVHRKRFRDIRPLGQRLAVLDHDRKGPHFHARRVEPGLAGAHVELPPVPGATQEFADARALVDAGLRRGQPRYACGLVERRARMWAAIEQRKELAVDMEHQDVASVDANHLVAAGRN